MSPLQAVIAGGYNLPPAPIYSHGALTGQLSGDGSCDEVLTPADWMCECDGRVTVGALAMLADSATGWATSTRLPEATSMVTAQLRLELFEGVPRNVPAFRIRANAVHVDPTAGFARADLMTDCGRAVGMATMRSAPVPHPLTQETVSARSVVAPPLPRGYVDDVLDTEEREASAECVEVAVRSRPQLANLSGMVHGGVVVMMVERAMVSLLAQLGDDSALRPLDVDVMYARPLDADDSIVIATAAVAALTRRFVHLAGTVTRIDGRVAATVRAAYARLA
jgi:uncharacterized protein (TIGR00369 family)